MRGWFPSGHWTTADSMGAYRALADFMIGAAVAIAVERRLFQVKSHGPGLAACARGWLRRNTGMVMPLPSRRAGTVVRCRKPGWWIMPFIR